MYIFRLENDKSEEKKIIYAIISSQDYNYIVEMHMPLI